MIIVVRRKRFLVSRLIPDDRFANLSVSRQQERRFREYGDSDTQTFHVVREGAYLLLTDPNELALHFKQDGSW